MSRLYRHTLYAALLTAGLAGCNKDSATDPLAFVPADSPYVFANIDATPIEVTRAWMDMYGTGLADIYADMAKDPQLASIEGDAGVWIRAALPELGKLASADGIAETGLKVDGHYALYGYGLLPVYRFQLADEAKLRALVAGIEQRAGKTLATRKIGDVTLWEVKDEKVTVLFGPIGGFLVGTLAPAAVDDARLQSQLGLTLPEKSMADSKALQTLNDQLGYSGHIVGYADIPAIARRMTGRDEGDNQVIAAFGGEVPKLTAECTAELDTITAKFPRLTFGTKALNAQNMDVRMTLEMEPALAKSIQGLAAPIPGASMSDSALFRFAMSFNIPESVRFLNGVADAIAAKPFACEELKNLNNSAAEMKQSLANPGLAMAGSVTAAHLGLTALALDAGSKQPSSLSAYLSVGSQSPVMLWGMAQASMPPLGQVSLMADGKIVSLPKELAPTPFPLELKAVMTGKSLALATSDIDDARLTAAATVADQADGTVLRYGVSGEFFKLLAENIPEPSTEDGADEQMVKDAKRGREMIANMGKAIKDLDVRLTFTERGLEVVETISHN